MKYLLAILACMSLLACGNDSSSGGSSNTATNSACSNSGKVNPVISTGGNWNLIWSDEFDGPSINNSKWEFETNCAGGGNNELQCYINDLDNAFIAAGILHIRAIQEPVSGDASFDGNSGVIVNRNYSSSRMRTLGLADWRYGRIEIRARLPFGQGIWPALWMLPSDYVYGDWPLSGEIDIMETVNLRTGGFNNNRVYATLHYSDTSNQHAFKGSNIESAADLVDDYHVFAIEWEQGEIRWYLNGRHYATQRQTSWLTCAQTTNNIVTTDAAPFDQRFHLIMNLAIGGNWPGDPDGSTTFPQEMLVDYVRVYQCDVNSDTGAGCSTVDSDAEVIQ